MLEGLWVVRFLSPDVPDMDMNGGVLVIESGRLMGGDSGYIYLGEIRPEQNHWRVSLQIKRHDPNVESVFGDIDEHPLEGIVTRDDGSNIPTLTAQLSMPGSPIQLVVGLRKVSELP